ncbi:hypothetical protein LCGC14_2680720 [marine sediment metagenome]|uniref:Uncharacterized protein n=1 Tax=marine sediment metagenome TaxID=412755 RepID=A0A0F9BW72_9ZZZZ
MSEQERVFVGRVVDVTTRCPVDVYAYMEGGCLYLSRDMVDNVHNVDNPITVVTREGLLRLSQGPFEPNLVMDHL